MKEYKIKCRYGIDNLMSEYVFEGSSQGDTSITNNLEEYYNSNGWLRCNAEKVPLTQTEVDKIVAERKLWNEVYINNLKINGQYGKEYDINLQIQNNSLFDYVSSAPPMESYRFVMLDLTKE